MIFIFILSFFFCFNISLFAAEKQKTAPKSNETEIKNFLKENLFFLAELELSKAIITSETTGDFHNRYFTKNHSKLDLIIKKNSALYDTRILFKGANGVPRLITVKRICQAIIITPLDRYISVENPIKFEDLKEKKVRFSDGATALQTALGLLYQFDKDPQYKEEKNSSSTLNRIDQQGK